MGIRSLPSLDSHTGYVLTHQLPVGFVHPETIELHECEWQNSDGIKICQISNDSATFVNYRGYPL